MSFKYKKAYFNRNCAKDESNQINNKYLINPMKDVIRMDKACFFRVKICFFPKEKLSNIR